MTTPKSKKRLTVTDFAKMKSNGEKISMLTAYDFAMAKMLDAAGVDMLLVGDSLAMVVQGHENTIPVTLDEMIYHGEMVARAAKRAFVVVDIPFPVNHHGIHEAVKAAGRIMKKTGCHAVKLEGGADQADVIRAMVNAGIPVIAHVGLRPQAVHAMGGYKVQRDRDELMADASAAQEAGAFCVLIECVPAEIATELSGKLRVPTIGIGAGAGCDGQVLVTNDMLGMTTGYVPSFVKAYANVAEQIASAVGQWCEEVKENTFPDEDHSF
ncbi:3-methyl-2-oxobutanoate hydroxymethyltransferase [Mariniblastus fucicola]|uniref:3-methyl-2-oxobutanoate hydroxymethyltransferase n=1 Tax=Mariniblastus fucicola TaxID=980251 RepID=A0A5B9P925_9BACT|nr:3-methyl-2-oxobutanoate hydroxymethyltransferase [Mariniblastus fucicola]QEG21136.1 3-methyl-2-oxobutanoate hydroxymethyltransferase [Mariniblastus fucicola]